MYTQVGRHELPSYQLDMEHGFEIGFKKGFEEGFEQGFKQGFEQGQANIIRALLTQLSAPEVAKLTGLELQQIEQLAKQKR